MNHVYNMFFVTSFSTVFVDETGSAHFPVGYDINIYIIITLQMFGKFDSGRSILIHA
jgi:hypothetical protein